MQVFQQQGKLISGYIQPFLLLPEISSANQKLAASAGIICESYNPESILKYFFSEKLKPITSFVENKPIDIGIWNIHLINKFIYFLEKTQSINELRNLTTGSPKSLYNKIKFANELGLLNLDSKNDSIYLSELGKQFVSAKDEYFKEILSEEQAKL